MSSPGDVLSYWFPEDDIFDADQETFVRQMQWWFQGGPEVDTQITERFAQVLEQDRRGELDHWADTPRGRLALMSCWTSSRAPSTEARPSPTHRTRKPWSLP